MTANQCATGDGVFSVGAGDVFDAVLTLSAAEAPAALDQLSGEIHASVGTALIEDSRFAREAAIDRLRQAFDAPGAGPDPDGGAWARVFGSMAQWDGDDNAAAMDRDIGGFFAGTDASVGGGLRLGLMGGYSRSDFAIDERGSSGAADTLTLGAYGGGEWDGFSLRGGATYNWHSLDTERAVNFGGFSDSLSARYDAHTVQAFGEAAYGMEAGPARFEPFASLAYVKTWRDGFTETGGAAALTSAGDAAGATFTTLGMRAETIMALGDTDATLRGMLGWRHGFGDTPEATLGFAAGGDAFTIAGAPISGHTLVLEAGLDVMLGKSASLGLSFGGQYGSGHSDHSAKASLGVNF
jgi:outer membrane autotransporter protein